MPQQINEGKVEDDKSVPTSPDSPQTSENNAKQAEVETDRKAKVTDKKSFSERWKTNRFWLVRATYYVLHSVWVVVMAIGAFIAWLIAMLFI